MVNRGETRRGGSNGGRAERHKGNNNKRNFEVVRHDVILQVRRKKMYAQWIA